MNYTDTFCFLFYLRRWHIVKEKPSLTYLNYWSPYYQLVFLNVTNIHTYLYVRKFMTYIFWKSCLFRRQTQFKVLFNYCVRNCSFLRLPVNPSKWRSPTALYTSDSSLSNMSLTIITLRRTFQIIWNLIAAL